MYILPEDQTNGKRWTCTQEIPKVPNNNVRFMHVGSATRSEAKEAFERWSRSHGVNVKHYHADNQRFAENAFMQHVDKCNQTISFCGEKAYFQNGRAERQMWTLQDLVRCQLLHAKMRWPSGISTCLWPYALKNVVDILNDTPNKYSKVSRVELFDKTEVRPNLRHHHHFGVPKFVLDDKAQACFKLSKWLAKARLGIYLGKSPRHSRSVALVLDPNTGLVNPQFHVRFDDVFETGKGKIDALHGRWKTLCGFTSSDISTSDNDGKTDARNKKEHMERTNRGDQRLRRAHTNG
jgi:hypothetical protein